ncbi:MAG: hypothetical protein QW794_05540 [Thermosphaera sp.]
MVRKTVTPAEKRIARFESKIDADVVRARIAAQKEEMVRSATARQAEIADVQAKVKGILETYGVLPELYVAFMKIGTKLYGLSRKHSGVVFENEVRDYLDLMYARYSKVFATTFPIEEILAGIGAIFNVAWSKPKA